MHGAAARDRGRERHHAAVRLHQEALLGGEAEVVEAAVEMADIVHHHRFEIGVEQRGGQPRPFADARQHLAGERDMHAGPFLVDERPRLGFVRRIHEGKEEADGDRLHARGLQLARGPPDRIAVERSEHLAGVVGTLGDFFGEALRRDVRRAGEEIVEQVAVARLALDLLHRAVALGDQQADLGAAHLQQRIGGDGGAVREKLDLVRRSPLAMKRATPSSTPSAGILRCAGNLFDRKCAGRGIEQHQIGMRAADVDPEAVAWPSHGVCLRCREGGRLPIPFGEESWGKGR